jgi:lipopolysaccharide transport system ATP-binding protein
LQNAIEVESLSKVYRLGEIGTGTLSQDLQRWMASLMGREDPFLKVGEANDRSRMGEGDIVYSLRNLDFSISQGDAVGIIGRNGAGKSTLLKILSRVTSPTTGEVRVKGRIASLLEVGTGFHPELTGRENIYLNGAILGMRKREITRRFDEIVDFSGVERYIDTPVKRYSSGMYVRLAFAVAAHLESEIMIIDEVLAVGDAEFQNKCINKMGEVGRNEGRTILFVSHNLGVLKRLCQKGILLHHGEMKASGPIKDVVLRYVERQRGTDSEIDFKSHVTIRSRSYETELVEIANEGGEPTDHFLFGEAIRIRIRAKVKEIQPSVFWDVTVENAFHEKVGNGFSTDLRFLKPGVYEIDVEVDNPLLPGDYFLSIGFHSHTGQTIEFIEKFQQITVSKEAGANQNDYTFDWVNGSVHIDTKWSVSDAVT